MMVTARKVAESEAEVRYEFGLDRDFGRFLTIDKNTWEARADDGHLDAPARAAAAKVYREWRERGEFPPGVVFAS
jgi:hypothetical protein